jgi:SIR2-like domain
MEFEYNPELQATHLQQCLSQDKRPIGFFLGSGCSMAVQDAAGNPLVPDLAALTKIVAANLHKAGRDGDFLAILANLKADGIVEPNLEQILTHIRALREVAGSGEARGFKKAQLEELDMQVCEEIVGAVSKELPGTQTPFHRLAAWINGTARDSAVEIFTTNYDLLIEQALEIHRVPYFDGFVGGCRPFFDAYAMEEDALPPRWARLWKVHGSINWRQTDEGIVYRAWNGGKGKDI